MKNSLQILIFMAMSLMFVAAMTQSITLYLKVSESVGSFYDSGRKLDRNITETLKTTPEYIVSGNQVLQSLNIIDDINCNITVKNGSNEVTFVPTLDIHKTNISIVNLSGSYKPKYNRSPDGSLTEIIYVMQ